MKSMGSARLPLDLQGRRVLVTGASAGLGAALARALVRDHGARPVLVARRRERLEALAAELRGAEVIALDLAAPEAVDALLAALALDPPFGAILNAAAYEFGDFTSLSRDRLEQILSLNVVSLARLSQGLLRLFEARGDGALLIIASTGGLMPAPGQALYAATKAFACNFALSLNAEARIPVCLCAPGGMRTDMINDSDVLRHLERNPLVMRSFLAPEAVAAAALEGWCRRRPLTVPGRLNQALVRAVGLLPRRLVGRGAARVYGR